MSSPIRHFFILCFFSLFIVSVAAQEEPAERPAEEAAPEPKPEPSLGDAKTVDDVQAYLQHEIAKHDWKTYDKKTIDTVLAEIQMSASDKMLEIAKTSDNPLDKWHAYQTKLAACQRSVTAEVEGTEQKLDTFLDELAAHKDSQEDLMIKQVLRNGRFFQFQRKAERTDVSPENFANFKTEWKTWIDRNDYEMTAIAQFGLGIAEKNDVPAEQFVKETVEYIRSEECPLSATDKTHAVAAFEGSLRTALGSDPKLYGKTLTYDNFSWENLRGRYVLIAFTSTWCGFCREELPGMREAYQKYHGKGLEIVSVYVLEFGSETEQIAKVRDHAEKKEKLPWIVLSEALTAASTQSKQSEFYACRSVPQMLLVNREGKIIMTNARGERLQTKLAEIFSTR